MKSKIKSSDFFCLLEMINRDVYLEMNKSTYKKIIGNVGGINPDDITNIQDMINGVKIEFQENIPSNTVFIIVKYIPHTREKLEIEII